MLPVGVGCNLRMQSSRIVWALGASAVLLALPACASAIRLRAGEGPEIPVRVAPFHAGAARIDLLPPWRLSLAGYGKRMGLPFEGVSERPSVRALWLRQEGSQEGIAIVSADLLIIPESLRQASLEKMAGREPAAFLLAATHTHSGFGNFDASPMAQLVATGGYRAPALDFLAQRIAQAVEQARANERPASLGVGVGEVRDLSAHRRDASRQIDPALAVIRVMAQNGPVARIVSFAAHPTVLPPENRMLSGDFPGFLCQELESRWGGVALFLNAACAEISPAPPGGGRDLAAARRMGEKLAEAAQSVDAQIAVDTEVALGARSAVVTLPERHSTGALAFPAGYLASPWLRPQLPLEARLQVFVLGDAALASFPCDLGVELGRRLREGRSGVTIPVSYADGFLGYAIDEESYEQGWYETRMSFYGRELGPFLLAASKEMTPGVIKR